MWRSRAWKRRQDLLTGEKAQIRDQLVQIQYNKPDRANPTLPELLLWASVIRSDGWKLSMYQAPAEQRRNLYPVQMFDLNQDRLEMRNLAKSPERQERLSTLQHQLKDGLQLIGADHSWITN